MKPFAEVRTRGRHPKVFYLGFHKTGTTSIGELLKAMGYRVGSAYGVNDHKFVSELRRGSFERALAVARRYDALEDNPWPLLYKELDGAFPGSRFILHVRSSGAWYESMLGEFGGSSTPMREFIYGDGFGDPARDRRRYIERYERHNEEVVAYFRGRDDLLILDLFNDTDAVRRIAEFLEWNCYPDALPRANPRQKQPTRIANLARSMWR